MSHMGRSPAWTSAQSCSATMSATLSGRASASRGRGGALAPRRVLSAALFYCQFPAAVVELPLRVDGLGREPVELRRELRLRLDVVQGQLPAALLKFLRRRGVFRC